MARYKLRSGFIVLGVLIVGLASIVIVLRTGINTFLTKVSNALSALIP